MDVPPANACLVALGRPVDLQAGDALPPFFHRLYFWAPELPVMLGRDGHPKVEGVNPDMGLRGGCGRWAVGLSCAAEGWGSCRRKDRR